MTGGSDVIFWVENLHARYFFGSRDLSCSYLGPKKIHIFFWVLSPSEYGISAQKGFGEPSFIEYTNSLNVLPREIKGNISTTLYYSFFKESIVVYFLTLVTVPVRKCEI